MISRDQLRRVRFSTTTIPTTNDVLSFKLLTCAKRSVAPRLPYISDAILNLVSSPIVGLPTVGKLYSTSSKDRDVLVYDQTAESCYSRVMYSNISKEIELVEMDIVTLEQYREECLDCTLSPYGRGDTEAIPLIAEAQYLLRERFDQLKSLQRKKTHDKKTFKNDPTATAIATTTTTNNNSNKTSNNNSYRKSVDMVMIDSTNSTNNNNNNMNKQDDLKQFPGINKEDYNYRRTIRSYSEGSAYSSASSSSSPYGNNHHNQLKLGGNNDDDDDNDAVGYDALDDIPDWMVDDKDRAEYVNSSDLDSAVPANDSSSCHSKNTYCSADVAEITDPSMTYFFQIEDGQLVYLHPLCLKMLSSHYANLSQTNKDKHMNKDKDSTNNGAADLRNKDGILLGDTLDTKETDRFKYIVPLRNELNATEEIIKSEQITATDNATCGMEGTNKNYQTKYLPIDVKSRVLEVEVIRVTTTTRRKLPFLRHLPQGCDVYLVEVDMKGLVSSHVMDKYRQDLMRRAKRRKLKLKALAREQREREDSKCVFEIIIVLHDMIRFVKRAL